MAVASIIPRVIEFWDHVMGTGYIRVGIWTRGVRCVLLFDFCEGREFRKAFRGTKMSWCSQGSFVRGNKVKWNRLSWNLTNMYFMAQVILWHEWKVYGSTIQDLHRLPSTHPIAPPSSFNQYPFWSTPTNNFNTLPIRIHSNKPNQEPLDNHVLRFTKKLFIKFRSKNDITLHYISATKLYIYIYVYRYITIVSIYHRLKTDKNHKYPQTYTLYNIISSIVDLQSMRANV